MNRVSTVMSMLIAAVLSAITMYKYSASFLLYSDTYYKFTDSHKILFIVSVPVGFVVMSLLFLMVTVPTVWMIQWHVNHFIKDMRDIW
jgi:di/tricarboxylate transporter